MKVLCVDDSRTMRRIIQGAVEVLDYEFIEARNGREALELLEKDSDDVALITLDWNMPEMDGLEFLQAAKTDPRFSDIPVMMVTALSEKENVATAIRAGAKHYLTKPFTPEELTTRMMETLGMGLDF